MQIHHFTELRFWFSSWQVTSWQCRRSSLKFNYVSSSNLQIIKPHSIYKFEVFWSTLVVHLINEVHYLGYHLLLDTGVNNWEVNNTYIGLSLIISCFRYQDLTILFIISIFKNDSNLESWMATLSNHEKKQRTFQGT